MYLRSMELRTSVPMSTANYDKHKSVGQRSEVMTHVRSTAQRAHRSLSPTWTASIYRAC